MLNMKTNISFPRIMRGKFFLHSGVVSLLLSMAIGCSRDQKSTAPKSSLKSSAVTLAKLPNAWDAEIYQDRTSAQLGKILDLLLAGKSKPADFSLLLSDEFATSALRPEAKPDFIRGVAGQIQVRRWNEPGFNAKNFLGVVGLREAFASLRTQWPRDASPRLTAKQIGIEVVAGQVVTKVLVDTFAAGSSEAVQQQAQWICTWELVGNTAPEPRLISIRAEKLEEVENTQAVAGPTLVDVTRSLIGELPCYRDNLRYGANYWIERFPRLKHRFHHGLAIGDVNGDQLEDVYLCQPEGIPNLLLLRQPDGSVREAAAEFGIDFLDNGTSSLLVDLDNDGDQDLIVAMRLTLVILENTGGQFEARYSLPPSGQIFSLAAADYDQDGLLDLYVCRYMNFDADGRAPNPLPLHDASNGGRNALLRNLSGWKFDDVTDAVGLDHNNTRWSVAASWEDYDNDGDLDLYLANDYGRNCLYRADRDASGSIHFQDVAPQVGAEDMTTGMSVAWSDTDHDGRMDVYISNMYSAAGRRVTYQKNFKRDVLGSNEDHVRAIQYTALGNSLFQNGSDGKFQHASEVAGVQRGLWGRATSSI